MINVKYVYRQMGEQFMFMLFVLCYDVLLKGTVIPTIP